MKEEAIIWALSDGYEVVLTDTDLVWIHNPMVDLAKNYRQYDFAFQSASKEDLEVQELNGGFLYIKPTKASQVAMNLLVSTLTQVSNIASTMIAAHLYLSLTVTINFLAA